MQKYKVVNRKCGYKIRWVIKIDRAHSNSIEIKIKWRELSYTQMLQIKVDRAPKVNLKSVFAYLPIF